MIPVFSFDVVSYGAGFTTISLRTFSLATIAGMVPPTFAFTYLGSPVVSAQWLLIQRHDRVKRPSARPVGNLFRSPF